MESSSSREENDLDVIQRYECSSSSEPTTSYTSTTKSSSDDCCWTIFKRRVSRQKDDVYTLSSTVQPNKPTRKISEVGKMSPTPSQSPDTSVLAKTRQRRMGLHSDDQLFEELSVDPPPRGLRNIPKFCVHITGFPVTEPEISYIWLIDICTGFFGYRALYVSNINKKHVFVEFCSFQHARRAAALLNNKQISGHLLCASVTIVPSYVKVVTVKETQV